MSLALYSAFASLLLEVEVAPSKRYDFENKYAELAGESPVGTDAYQLQDNKWGLECRIYFDAEDWVVESLVKLGYHVEDRSGGGYRSEYQYRINSERLFWKLISHGYRLGTNPPR